MNQDTKTNLNNSKPVNTIEQIKVCLYFSPNSDPLINTSKDTIENQLNKFTNNFARKTGNTKLILFEKLLYIYSSYNFINPAYNFNSYAESPFIISSTTSDEFNPKDYSFPDEFCFILKLIFNYLIRSKFLTYNTEINDTYTLNRFCNTAYKAAEFKWHISENFMPFFCTLIITVNHFYKPLKKSKSFSFEKFFTFFEEKLLENTSFPLEPFADSTLSRKAISFPCENFIDIWLDSFLARKYLLDLNSFLENFSSNSYRKTLLDSLIPLNRLLLAPNSSFEVFHCLELLLADHRKNFPLNSQSKNSHSKDQSNDKFYAYESKYLYSEEKTFVNNFHSNMTNFFNQLNQQIKNTIAPATELSSKYFDPDRYDSTFFKTSFPNYKTYVANEIKDLSDTLSNRAQYSAHIIESHCEHLNRLTQKHFSAFESIESNYQLFIRKFNGLVAADRKQLTNDISLSIDNLRHDCEDLLNCKIKSLPYPVKSEPGEFYSCKVLTQYNYVSFNKIRVENLVKNLNFDTDDFFNCLKTATETIQNENKKSSEKPVCSPYFEFTPAELCSAITEYIKKHPEYLAESTE